MTSSSDGAILRLTVLVGEGDVVGHKPLYPEIVHRAHAAGLRGASVFRGIEGFGQGSTIHTNRLLDLSRDLPVAIVIIDAAERVLAFVRDAAELWGTGLAVLDEVTLVAPHGGDHSG